MNAHRDDDLAQALQELGDDEGRPHPMTPEQQLGQFRAVKRRRRATQVGVGVAVCGVLVIAAVTGPGGFSRGNGTSVAFPPIAQSASPEESAHPSVKSSHPFGALADGSAACVKQEYVEQSLSTRAFAFDGTVTEISEAPTKASGGAPGFGDPVPVTFRVTQWFRGGSGTQVTVTMTPPLPTGAEPDLSYGIGTRLLVSGAPRTSGRPPSDLIAGNCGFTRYYDETTAADWRRQLS